MAVAIGIGVVLVALAVATAAVGPAAVISLLNDFHLLGQWSPYSTLIAGTDRTSSPRPRPETPPWPPASS
jgi:hypothetical protein